MGGGLEGPGRKSEPDWANRRTQRQTGVGREREGERVVEPTGRHGPIETNLSSTQATSLNPTLALHERYEFKKAPNRTKPK